MVRICILFILFLSFQTFGQSATANDSMVTIKGKVVDTTAIVSFFDLLVVNRTLGKGIFGDYTGEFSIEVKKSDLIGVSVVGYQSQNFTFKDSVYKPVYDVIIYLETRSITGKEVVVKPIKNLDQLKEERESLAKREVPRITGISVISSPITALYMAFSKREKTKRKFAELEFKEKQDDIVKEILRLYVHADIIDLSSEEFESFITFLNMSLAFLQTASDYDLIVYIKEKYEHYRRIQEGF